MKQNRALALACTILVLILAGLAGTSVADIYVHDEDVIFHCEDSENYNINSTGGFDHIVIGDTYVQFNTSAFHCDFADGINVTIDFLNVMNPYGNLTILSFYYTQEGVGFYDFNISGFLDSQPYIVLSNGTILDTVTSSPTGGWVNFTSDILWGDIDIILYEYLLLSNENPVNNSWVVWNASGFNTSISVNYSNFGGDTYVYGNFSWYNETDFIWYLYDDFNLSVNGTNTSVTNANFSSIFNTYEWRVTATASDTGASVTETYTFTTYSEEVILQLTQEQLAIVLSSTFMIFFLYIGYESPKPSGGALMIFAGMCFIYLGALLKDYSFLTFILFIVPLSFFIILMGTQKLLYTPERTGSGNEGRG